MQNYSNAANKGGNKINFIAIIFGTVKSALLSLIDYLSFHVLLCLVPAFFIAGAMTVFIPTDKIMGYIGPTAKKRIAYPLAAIGGLLLAVCSCTVIPLFVGIYKKGAGLGPAITFLFAAPAVNILALVYTGTMIGMDIALARALLALSFSMLIGILMDLNFSSKLSDDIQENNASDLISSDKDILNLRKLSILLVTLNLLSGISLVLIEVEYFLVISYALGIITLLLLSYKPENRFFTLFMWLVFLLFVGTSRFEPFNTDFSVEGINIPLIVGNMLAKLFLVLIATGLFAIYCKVYIETDDLSDWFEETWIFTKSIFPLIIIGVVIAGGAKFFVPESLIVSLVGSNSLLSNLVAVLFGVFMYFPTLMEVPIARTLLDLGMAKGPLLAYLLADPELSIQSILVTRKYLGDRKNLIYVAYVTFFTTISGVLFGLFLNEGITFF